MEKKYKNILRMREKVVKSRRRRLSTHKTKEKRRLFDGRFSSLG